MALKALTEQVEERRRQLEEQKAKLAQEMATQQAPQSTQQTVQALPPLPQGISDIMSGKTLDQSQPEPKPLNMMDYLRRTAAAKQGATTTTVMSAPPMPPSMAAMNSNSDPRLHERSAPPVSDPRQSQADSSTDRPKISFSFGSKSKPPGPASHHQRLRDDEEPVNRPYLPPPTNQPLSGVAMPNQPPPASGFGPPGGSVYRNQNPPVQPLQQGGYQSPQRLPFAPAIGGYQNNRGGVDYQSNRGGDFQSQDYQSRQQRGDVDYRQPQQHGGNDRRGWQDRGGRDDRSGYNNRPHGQQGYNRGQYQDNTNRQRPYDRRGGYNRRDY